MSISEQLTGAMKGMFLIAVLCMASMWLTGFAIGKSQVKNCTANNQCRLHKSPKEGYKVKLDEGKDGGMYVWGEN